MESLKNKIKYACTPFDDIQSAYNGFCDVYSENGLLAIKLLLFLRRLNTGIGNDKVFHEVLKTFSLDNKKLVINLIPIFKNFIKFEDIYCLLDGELKDDVVKYCYLIAISGIKGCKNGSFISNYCLCMPDENSPYNEYIDLFSKGFNLNRKTYIKMTKMFKEYSKVIKNNNSYVHVDLDCYDDIFKELNGDKYLCVEEAYKKSII